MLNFLEENTAVRESLADLYNAVSNVLSDRTEIIKNGNFRQVLEFINQRNMVHYTRLIAAMGSENVAISSVFRWYSGDTIPDKFKQNAAIFALQKIIDEDIVRITNNEEPIGGLSTKFHPQKEYTL